MIRYSGVDGYYLKSDASGSLTITKEWLIKTDWHNNKNVNSSGLGGSFGANEEHGYRITARSIARGEETAESLESKGKTPAASFTINTQEQQDDYIQVNWSAIDGKTNLTNYEIWSSIVGGGWVFVSSVTKTNTSFNHDIDGSTPASPGDINTKIAGKSVTISWTPVANPAASQQYSHQVIAIAEVHGSSYTVTTSQPSSSIAVTPVIKGYNIYYPDSNTLYSVSTSTQITVENLEINATHYFYISTLSSDDLESAKKEVSVYLFYSTSSLELSKIDISSNVSCNNMFVGVPRKPEITLKFNKVVDTTTINQNTICIRAIKDNKNNTISKIIPAALSITDNQTAVRLDPELDYGYSYELTVYSVRDILGQSITYTTEFTTLYDLSVENKMVPKTTAYVEISNPEQLNTDKGYILVAENPQKTEIDIAKNKLGFDKLPVTIAEIDLINEQETALKQFEKFITITIGYSDSDNNGFIDSLTGNHSENLGIKVDSLAIWHLNEQKGAWMKLPSTIDKIRKVVTAKTKQLSVFALIGVLNYSTVDTKVYPVPWIPEDGKQLTGTIQDGIRFINLPVEGEILVYTLTGELVVNLDFDASSNGEKVWYGKNQDEQEVASGVYLWLVQTSRDKKTGKLIIIR